MFGIGTSELIIIIILAFLIIGPKDLPKIGREVGRIFNTFGRVKDDVKEGITKEIGVAAKDIGRFIHEEDNGEKD